MQNNQSQENKFLAFLKEKGYYIVLSLCAVAVGISGYVFVSTAVRQNRAVEEETLSVPITVTEPEKADPKPTVPASTEVTTQPEPADRQTSDDAVRQAAAQIIVRPVQGEILSPYAMDKLAYNETTKDWRVHNGVDLAAMPGQVVQAVKAGTVTAVYEDEFYGTTVVLSHDGGYTTRYSNLTPISTVEAGQTVAAGDIIGAVGSSALLESALEPHLHFEVSCNGVSVDPMAFLP